MTAPESIFPDALSEEERALIDSICDRFEHAWKTSTPPKLEEFLTLQGLALQVLHQELLNLEQAYRDELQYRKPNMLHILDGPQRGKSLRLCKGTFLVGRDPCADIALPENVYCSWRHLLIEVTPTLCLVRDLGAKNGTRLDGERIESGVATTLSAGKTLQVGDTRILAD